jgi:hypothetical protein
MTKENPLDHMQLVAKSDLYPSVYSSGNAFVNHFVFMNLAPDGKIYGPGGNTTHMHRIEYPDEKWQESTVSQHAIETVYNGNTIPNFPNFRLGPLDGSPADTLGLDNHPIAKFRYEQDTTNHLNVRFTDLSYFRPETWHWDFGDGTTFTGKKPYWHEFPSNGTYNVCLTVSNENNSNTMCRTVTIGTNSTHQHEPVTNDYISVFPNPTEGEVLLTISEYIPEYGVIYIYDMMGREVFSSRIFYGWNSISLNHFINGQYIYKVFDKNHKISQGSIIKI